MAEPKRCTGEVIRFACALRPEWDADDVEAAIGAATGSAWAWEAILTGLVRLVCDPVATPRDLVGTTRHGGVSVPADPERTRQLIADWKRENEGRGPCPKENV